MLWRISCRDDSHAAAETARIVLDAFVAAGERNFALALSGGRIAPAFFAALVAQAAGRRVALADADFFWADERCVEPHQPDSNYRVARAALLDPLGGGRGGQVHRLEGEQPPAEGAARANADWKVFERRRGRAAARLDCVVLGVGEDGHVASLFPENLAADLAATTPYQAVTGSKPPPWRLTMGYRLLHEARQVVILATGAGKESVLSGSLSGALATPLATVLKGRRERETVLVSPLKLAA